MTQQKGTHTAGQQSKSSQRQASESQMISDTTSQTSQSDINSTITTSPTTNQSQMTRSSTTSADGASGQQTNSAQQMSYETGLEYTSDVIRQEKLKPKNQQAANSLVDRMYWQHEESLSKSINVNDKGELESYDDTPGLGSDKPGV